MKVSTVYVPVESRREATRILPIAATVAGSFGAPLRMVHVVADRDSIATTAVRAWLEPLADEHDAALYLIEHQSVSRALRDLLVDEPDALVCMQVDATGGRIDGLLGSVASDILHAGHHHCLLVGPAVEDARSVADGPVVACVDGSTFSETILPSALDFADAMSATTWIVAVTDDSPLPADVLESGYVHAVASKLAHPHVEWETLRGGDPARAIVDFADLVDAGSIAMATHGRGGLGRVALGSVALRVVHTASCPVLVQRPPSLVVVTEPSRDASAV